MYLPRSISAPATSTSIACWTNSSVSLVRRHRDPRSGKIFGNLYVLHDEPLTPFEAMQLDPNYLGLVSRALDHASRSIQRVGVHTLKEMSEDPALAGRVLPRRISPSVMFHDRELVVRDLWSQFAIDGARLTASTILRVLADSYLQFVINCRI